MSQPRPSDPIGSIGWTERTGGVLTARECLTLSRPLLRAELSIVAGGLAMVLGMHSGRWSSIDPAGLLPPDSALARDAGVAAQDLLTPALLNHSSRACTWGAAIAALHGITFDRELMYVAAMFHDTGIPSPVPGVEFTVRSAALAREFAASHDVSADRRVRRVNAPLWSAVPGHWCSTRTFGVTAAGVPGSRAFACSPRRPPPSRRPARCRTRGAGAGCGAGSRSAAT